jgi:GWxTD domain-containing protein
MAIPLLVGGVAFSAVPQAVSAQQGSDGSIRLRVARFWRGEGRTLLEGVVGLPVARETRTVELTIRDSAGTVLHNEATTDSAHAQATALAAINAEITHMIELVLQPGSYNVTVLRKEAERTDSSSASVRAFASAPVISDVVVSANMRLLGENEQPAAVEMQRGRYAIERGIRVTILPSQPRLWYYLELYRQNADSVAQLEFRITPHGKDSALVRVNRNVAVGARGTVDAAALMVEGLPPGDYTLTVVARTGQREERRTADFTMGSFETGPTVVAPTSAPPTASASESALYDLYFAPAVRSDAEIKQIVEALTVGAPGVQVPPETTSMTADAQRRYLARYWARLPDPVPATSNHELVEEYAVRVQYVERHFKERGRAGVRTDRGKIYLKLGPPDVSQQLPSAARRAVEVWKYTRARSLKFAFLDQTGFQDFVLVYTTDPQERSLPDWQEKVNEIETVRAILNF